MTISSENIDVIWALSRKALSSGFPSQSNIETLHVVGRIGYSALDRAKNKGSDQTAQAGMCLCGSLAI